MPRPRQQTGRRGQNGDQTSGSRKRNRCGRSAPIGANLCHIAAFYSTQARVHQNTALETPVDDKPTQKSEYLSRGRPAAKRERGAAQKSAAQRLQATRTNARLKQEIVARLQHASVATKMELSALLRLSDLDRWRGVEFSTDSWVPGQVPLIPKLVYVDTASRCVDGGWSRTTAIVDATGLITDRRARATMMDGELPIVP